VAVDDVQYRYVSLDSDHDISAVALTVGLDGVTFPVTADPVAAPAHAAALPGPGVGLTRYWWRVLIGPGQQLVPVSESSELVGRLADDPEVLHPSWRFVP
jgi:hypothetical protein